MAPVCRGGGRSRCCGCVSYATTPHSVGDVAAVVGLFIGMVLAERFPVPVEGMDAGGVTLGFVFAVAGDPALRLAGRRADRRRRADG